MSTEQKEITLLSTYLAWLDTCPHNTLETGWFRRIGDSTPDFYRNGQLAATINSVGVIHFQGTPIREEYVCADITTLLAHHQTGGMGTTVFAIDVITYTGDFPATEKQYLISTLAEWERFLARYNESPITPEVKLTQIIPITFRPPGMLNTIMMAGLDSEGRVWGFIGGNHVDESKWVPIELPTL